MSRLNKLRKLETKVESAIDNRTSVTFRLGCKSFATISNIELLRDVLGDIRFEILDLQSNQ